MTTGFVPKLPERTITVTITLRELVLLQILRRYNFGQFIVHKVDGKPQRVVINDSQIIDEEEKVDLESFS